MCVCISCFLAVLSRTIDLTSFTRRLRLLSRLFVLDYCSSSACVFLVPGIVTSARSGSNGYSVFLGWIHPPWIFFGPSSSPLLARLASLPLFFATNLFCRLTGIKPPQHLSHACKKMPPAPKDFFSLFFFEVSFFHRLTVLVVFDQWHK